MEGGMDGRLDVRKFPSVFYRTSALWDRCLKRAKKEKMSAKKTSKRDN